ncbi:unnamed protein product [Closterium sp. Naga37s-1]|nr:unnamed protein product [Closterium sp. Naga37s-1]
MKRCEVALCKEAPSDVRLEMHNKYEAHAAATEEKQRAVLADIAWVKAGGKRARMTDYLEGDTAAAKREAHEGLALMFAAFRLPENLIDHPLFVNSMHLVTRAGGGYVPPRRKYIGRAGLLACQKGIENGLMGIKASWKKTGVTIASGMMTDKCGWPQANVLLVNDAGAILKECVDCNMEKKTGGYVAGLLKPVVEEVGPENIVAFCMDGGSNYAAACQQLIEMWPHIQQVPCATHVMDLLMEDVRKMGWSKKVVDRGAEMISFTRNHHWTRGYLRNPELVEGKLRPSLTQMVLSDEWKVWAAGSRKAAAEGFAALVLDSAWWKTAEIYDVMTEDVGALVDADEEQLCYSEKQQIRRILKNRWDESLACAMHVAARILNPANAECTRRIHVVEEDIFGSDAECTRIFKVFLHQHAEFLVGHDGKGGDGACDYLVELGGRAEGFLGHEGEFRDGRGCGTKGEGEGGHLQHGEVVALERDRCPPPCVPRHPGSLAARLNFTL